MFAVYSQFRAATKLFPRFHSNGVMSRTWQQHRQDDDLDALQQLRNVSARHMKSYRSDTQSFKKTTLNCAPEVVLGLSDHACINAQKDYGMSSEATELLELLVLRTAPPHSSNWVSHTKTCMRTLWAKVIMLACRMKNLSVYTKTTLFNIYMWRYRCEGLASV